MLIREYCTWPSAARRVWPSEARIRARLQPCQ